MKRVLTLLILILGLSAKAQVKVSGKITDNKGKPVGGVSIALKDTYDGATTDSLGNFSFTTTEKGHTDIRSYNYWLSDHLNKKLILDPIPLH